MSAKSLRKGSASELCLHPKLNDLSDICNRTGHSFATNIDSYADKRNVTRSTRGGKALAGWEEPKGVVKPPIFECLGDDTPPSVQRLIEKLFVVHVPAFMPGGHLRGVL